MDEKKKITVLISVMAAIILLIVVGSFYESAKSKKYLKDFYSAFKSDEGKLVMIGRDDCGWCQLFKPNLDYISEKYGFDFLYVNTNKLTSSVLKKLLKDINVSESDFGTPLTLYVKGGSVVDSISGYADETVLFDFLKNYKLVSADSKLPLNYIDYNGYKGVAKSTENKILVLGQTTCQYCIKSKLILNKIVDNYGILINYLDITNLTSEEREKLPKYISYLSDNEWGTPLTLIVKNGEVIDSANGMLDYDSFVKLFKDNGFIK